jgi:hypothetical protein
MAAACRVRRAGAHGPGCGPSWMKQPLKSADDAQRRQGEVAMAVRSIDYGRDQAWGGPRGWKTWRGCG